MNATPPRDTEIYRLIMRVRAGGSIVSASTCSNDEIAIARSEHRLTIDKDGHGYIYRPSPR